MAVWLQGSLGLEDPSRPNPVRDHDCSLPALAAEECPRARVDRLSAPHPKTKVAEDPSVSRRRASLLRKSALRNFRWTSGCPSTTDKKPQGLRKDTTKKAASKMDRAARQQGAEAQVKARKGRPPKRRSPQEARVAFADDDDAQTRDGYSTDASEGARTPEEEDRREDEASLHTALNGEDDHELRANRTIKNLFGRWTREEAARAASRSEMLRLSFKEDLTAALAAHQTESQTTLRQVLADQRQQLEAVVEERLMQYTPAEDFKSLMDRVDVLSDRVRSLTGEPKRHVKQEVPRELKSRLSALNGQSEKVHWDPELDSEVQSAGEMQARASLSSPATRTVVGCRLLAPFPTDSQGQDSTYTVSMPTFPRDWLGPARARTRGVASRR